MKVSEARNIFHDLPAIHALSGSRSYDYFNATTETNKSTAPVTEAAKNTIDLPYVPEVVSLTSSNANDTCATSDAL